MIGVSAVDARDRRSAGFAPLVLVAYQVLDVSQRAPLDIGADAVGFGGVTVLRRIGEAHGLGAERREILLRNQDGPIDKKEFFHGLDGAVERGLCINLIAVF